ncbi:MAG TPA: hypothetical protein VKZ97_07645 [Flavobacteriaceae bacterium]|nr:hypothetical protein [Flavobacteriaceae bacterium]
MRKSILIIALFVFTLSTVNATNNKTLNTSTEAVELTKDNLTKVYDWTVKTNKGSYAGTSPSLEDANRMIALSTSGEIILEKSIVSFYMLKSEVNKEESRNYFWEVEYTNGYAKGYSSSKSYAEKMIALAASGNVVTSKIIISQPSK